MLLKAVDRVSSANSRSGTRISDGPSAASAAATPSRPRVRVSTSPVESSTLATAAWPARTATAASRLDAARVQEAVLGQGARRDHPHHVAADDRLVAALPASAGIFHLLADRDLEPGADQLGQIGLGGVNRHARHGDRLAAVIAA